LAPDALSYALTAFMMELAYQICVYFDIYRSGLEWFLAKAVVVIYLIVFGVRYLAYWLKNRRKKK
jgi:uncharacterized membrane protein